MAAHSGYRLLVQAVTTLTGLIRQTGPGLSNRPGACTDVPIALRTLSWGCGPWIVEEQNESLAYSLSGQTKDRRYRSRRTCTRHMRSMGRESRFLF